MHGSRRVIRFGLDISLVYPKFMYCFSLNIPELNNCMHGLKRVIRFVLDISWVHPKFMYCFPLNIPELNNKFILDFKLGRSYFRV